MDQITLTPTIVVGIGSSGLSVLNHIQNLLYEHFGDIEDDHIWLVNIETDINNLPQKTPSGQKIINIPMRTREGSSMEKEIAILKEMDIHEWRWTEGIAWETGFGVTGAGAGGMRVAGRIVLNAQAENATNKDKFNSEFDRVLLRVKEKRFDEPSNIEKLRKKIHRNAAIPEDTKPNPRCYIVGTLTGGTGSGMFIDIAREVYRKLKISEKWDPRLLGIFFVPPTGSKTENGIDSLGVKRANTFGSLYELSKIKYDYKNGITKNVPYKWVYLLSPQYHMGEYFQNIDTLFEMTAEKIFIDSLGFANRADAWRVDDFSANPECFFGTFGMASIKYPFHSMLGYTSFILTQRFLERLIDSKYYKGEHEPYEVVNSQAELWEDALRWFSMLVAPLSEDSDNPGIFEDFKQDVKNEPWRTAILNELEEYISKTTISDDDLRNLAIKFKDGYFYQGIQAFKSSIIKRIENEAFGQLLRKFEESNNLQYVFLYLEGLLLAIAKHDRLLELERIPNKIGDWKIGGQLDDVRKRAKQGFSINKAINQNKEVLEDLMLSIGDQLISVQVRQVYAELTTTFISWHKKIRDCIGKIRSIHIETLVREVSRIEADLKDTSKPIYRLYQDKMFSDDKDRLIEKCVGNANWPPSLKDLDTNVGSKEILNAFLSDENAKDKIDPLHKVTMDIQLSLQGKCRGKLVEMLSDFNIEDKFGGAAKNIIRNTVTPTLGGFLRYEDSKFREYRVNIISELEKEQIDNISSDLGISEVVYNKKGGRGGYSHPTFKHSVYIYNEVFGLEMHDLADFDVLLSAYKEENPRFRLCYNKEVDHKILSKNRYETVKRLLNYVRFFWLKPIKSPDGRIEYDQVSHRAIPKYDKSKSQEGIEILPGRSPHLVFADSPMHFAKVNIITMEGEAIDQICSDVAIYNRFKKMILLSFVFDATGRDENYNASLRFCAEQWINVKPILDLGTDEYRAFFGDPRRGEFDVQNVEATKDLLGGDLGKILDIIRLGESHVEDFELK